MTYDNSNPEQRDAVANVIARNAHFFKKLKQNLPKQRAKLEEELEEEAKRTGEDLADLKAAFGIYERVDPNDLKNSPFARKKRPS